ncbi:MAG: Crp/Fnr family transcriptional regulator [Chloroflexota bacterium]
MASAQRDSLAHSLARAPVLASLAVEDIAELARCAVRRDFERGQLIFREGDMWPHALYLASGWLRWTLTDRDGHRQMLLDVPPGNLVWGHSLFDGLPMPADLEAREPSVTYRWDRTAVRAVLGSRLEAMWELCGSLTRAMRRARELIFSFAFQSVAQRPAALLLRWYPAQDGRSVRRELTLEEMAAYVGSTPALVCKTLYGFADMGLLRISRTEFEFLDRNGLKQIATSEPMSTL